MDQARLEELKAEHGDIYVLTIEEDDDDHELVVRMPTRAEFDRFTASDEKKANRALVQLVKDCTLHPSKEELGKLFNSLPGLGLSFGKELARLAGAMRDVRTKKV